MFTVLLPTDKKKGPGRPPSANPTKQLRIQVPAKHHDHLIKIVKDEIIKLK